MKIAIYGRLLDASNVKFIQDLFDELSKKNIPVTIYEKFLPHIKNRIRFNSDFDTFLFHEDIRGKVDYLFSLGGDGTLLDTVALIKDSDIPVMGINVGRLGFLSSVSKEEIKDALDLLEKGSYVLDKRDLLHLDSNKPIFEDVNFALNEFTIHKKDTSSMIVIHTYINGEFLNSYWADGLIVATPTGSTAYSLSCGGPVIYPSAKNFVITPVSPHHLNVRPLVVPDNCIISFEMEGRSENFLCTLDSRMRTIDSTYQLAVKKEAFTLNLIRLQERNFLSTLRSKLLWGFDKRN